MQILLITQEPPLTPDEVATGNAIRTAQIESALSCAGHDVRQTWLDPSDGRHPGGFRNRDELQATIIKQNPDVILLAYWELLELLPFELQQPVIVDFVAPRPLEVLFEHPERVGTELIRLQTLLVKADLLLTGNEAQRDLLWYSLLQAGFDLRGNSPVLVIPLASTPAGHPQSDPRKDGWTLVSGGVSWPWRKSDEYWKSIQSMQDEPGSQAPRLILFGGQYRWHEDSSQESSHLASSAHPTQALTPYANFSRFLLQSAHIGLEVAQPNIERRYSQSFRSLEFLRHGLPLICNDYLPIAGLVRKYKAGWTVRGPEDMSRLLRAIMAQPDEWKQRSENALQLVSEALNPDTVAAPLLDWLEMATKAPRLPGLQRPPAAVVLGKPRLADRLKRQFKILRRVVLSRVFNARPGNNILIVTRSDIFPDDHGAAVKIVETARGLSQHGRKVGIVSDDRRHWWLFEDGRERRCKLPFYLRFLSLPRPLAKLLHLSKDLPESNSFLYLPLSDSSFFWHCLYVGHKLNAGILQAEFPAYAKPCLDAREILDASVVLVEHNVEYARLKAQVAELSEKQFRNLRAIETDLCNRSDAVICVSDNDRQQLLNDGVKAELMHTIPHGFNPAPYLQPPMPALTEKFALPENAVLLAFHGTFSYPPNRKALTVFAEEILPRLEKSGHPFHLIAIGRNPPTETLHPNMHFTGSVDEVAPWLKACDIAVIPLTDGGGTRMKIVDCFAAGLPVISTAKGIEGIPVVNGEEAIITDNWSDMCTEIIQLAESRKLRDSLSAAARDFAANMDWESIAGRYITVFNAIRRPAK